MKQLKIFLAGSLLTVAGIMSVSLSSCEEKECPEDMVECSLDDGTEICVPDHIGC